jgi:hypothetical protein
MKLDLRYFIVSLALGLFFVYLTDETPVIVVYPTPNNIDLYQVRKEGSCYAYDLKEVSCTQDAYQVDKNNAL